MRGNPSFSPFARLLSCPTNLRILLGDSKGQSPFVMRGNPSFSPYLKSEEGDSKGQSPFVMIKQYHFSKIIFDEIRKLDFFNFNVIVIFKIYRHSALIKFFSPLPG